MNKTTISLFSVAMLCMGFINFSEASSQPTVNPKDAQVAAITENNNNLKDLAQCAEPISPEEMKNRLERHSQDDELFVKVNENDVFALKNIINNESLQKQLIYLLPEGKMQHFYTNNKKTADSMSKMLKHFQNNVIDVNGYRIVTDKDKVEKEKLAPTYHFWCIKLKYSRVINRVYGYNYPMLWGWDWWGWHHPVIYHHGHGGHRPHRR